MGKLALLLFAITCHAATYIVNAAGGGDYTTIQACANVAVAGDTCSVVVGGTYNERVTVPNSGSAGNVITFKAATDCVSGNGATIAASCAKVRGFTLSSKNYITIQGFEVTNQGMSTDTTQSFLLSGSDRISILNNYVHDTTSNCIRYSNGSDYLWMSGNNMQYCAEAMQIVNTLGGPFTITAGVNDGVTLAVQGVNRSTTLTAGSRTGTEVMLDIVAGIPGLERISGATNKFSIWSTTLGPTSSLAVVSGTANSTIGLSVGEGRLYGTSGAVNSNGTQSTDALFENNVISYVSDYFTPSSSDTRFVYRNNVLGPVAQWTSIHIDGWQPGPSSDILIEGNLSIDNNNSDNHFLLNQTTASHYIIRYNRTCRANGSIQFQYSGMYFYSNTFYDNFASMVSGGLVNGGSQLYVNDPGSTGFARNNIWYKSVNPSGFNGGVYDTASGGTIDHDYSLWFGFTNPGDTNYVNAEPLLVNGENCDLRLSAASPARNAGGPLTTVAAADTGSGTSLVLTDASYFQPGWAGTSADWIRIGSTTTAQISSIDYGTNTITLAASGVSRSDGDSVYLYKNSSGVAVLLDGQAPDLGALPLIPTGSYTSGPLTRSGPISIK